jgi:hypothetical protein
MIAPVVLAVVSFIAGHPTGVVCDATLNGHEAALPGAVGWTAYGGDTVYVVPAVCAGLTFPVGEPGFGAALGTVIHEATHARGIRSEACAEWNADHGIYEVLRDFYGFATLDSWAFNLIAGNIAAEVVAETRRRPPQYQPELCPDGVYP